MPDKFSPLDHKKIIAAILEQWAGLGLPQIDKATIKFKVMPFRRSGQHSLVNYMILSSDRPVLVIKVPRFKEGQLAFAAIETEAASLSSLAKNPDLAQHLPQLYKMIKIDQTPVLITKAYQGKMLHSLLDSTEDNKTLETLLLAGVKPLDQLILEPAVNINIDFIKSIVLDRLTQITKAFPDQAKTIKDKVETFLKFNKFSGQSLPLAYLHREYNPWNLMKTSEGNIIIFDWEDSQNRSLPLLDLYNYFMVSSRILLIGETKETKKRSQAAQQQRVELLIKVFREACTQYCAKLDIKPELLDLLFLVYAIDITSFFIEQKRQAIDYAKHWLPLIMNLSQHDCFVNHVKYESQTHWRNK